MLMEFFKNKSYNNREARKKGKERIMENTKGQSIFCYLVLSWKISGLGYWMKSSSVLEDMKVIIKKDKNMIAK